MSPSRIVVSLSAGVLILVAASLWATSDGPLPTKPAANPPAIEHAARPGPEKARAIRKSSSYAPNPSSTDDGSATEPRENESVVLSGHVTTVQGVPFAAGKVVAVAPHTLSSRQHVKVDVPLTEDGDFSVELPRNQWKGPTTYLAVSDSNGGLLTSGIVTIGEHIQLQVTPRAASAWKLEGAVSFEGAPDEFQGWLALELAEGAHQPLAEGGFKGNPCKVTLSYNLGSDSNRLGAVRLLVVDHAWRTVSTVPFESIGDFAQKLSEGLSLPTDFRTLLIPAAPSGRILAELQVADRRQTFMNNAWHKVKDGRATLPLGTSKDLKVWGRRGEHSVYGFVEEFTGDDRAAVRWMVETPGTESLRVHVTGPSDEPLHVARIAMALMSDGPEPGALFTAYGSTDQAGVCVLPHLPRGRYAIRVRGSPDDGVQPKRETVSVPGDLHVKLGLRARVWVEAVAPSAAGLGERIVTHWRRLDASSKAWQRVELDARLGRLFVDKLTPGRYELRVSREPFVGWSEVQVLPVTHAQRVTVKCDLPDTVDGRLVDANGQPVPNRRISWATSGSETAEWLRGASDAAGNFTLHRPRTGKAILRVWDKAAGVVEATISRPTRGGTWVLN